MIDLIISSMINVHIKVLSLRTDLNGCKTECNGIEGHLPYSFEGSGLIPIQMHIGYMI